MSDIIKIKKGFDISVKGEAKNWISNPNISSYAFKPSDYIGIKPKLVVKEGDKVRAGDVLYFSKQNEKILFTSSVSGEVKAIRRGAKRCIEEIEIESNSVQSYKSFSLMPSDSLQREEIIEKLLESGLWTLIRQRPYSIIPNPNSEPKCIIIKSFDSSPLAADYNILVRDKIKDIQEGIDIIKKLTKGKVYLNVHTQKTTSKDILNLQGVEINKFEGQHPVGNISVQIAKLDPINKGESIWYIDLQDLAIIGKFFSEGRVIAEKTIALVGQEVLNPQYYNIKLGACISSIIQNNVKSESNLRYISGNILTGKNISCEGYIGAYDNMITVIKEGNYYEFFGWVMPGLKKFSFSRTFLSGFLNLLPSQYRKPIEIDTNLHGGRRAFVMTGEFEKVMPLDIYPMQLIKACIIEDIDLMEELGIYEVDSEDFALCEVMDVSKTDIQQIIRKAHDLMRKEMGE